MKTLGVLGGMGPAATLDFLARLQALTPARGDEDHIRVIADINPQVPNRNTDAAGAARTLADMAASLRDAGAEALAMPCNTAHAHAKAITDASGLPLIHMIAETVDAARAVGAARPGVLGTPSGRVLYAERMGGAAVLLGDEDQTAFMGLIGRIKAGAAGEDERAEMTALAERLIDGGADGVIAGCTEVPLVLRGADLTVPLIDSTEVLARACVRACRSDGIDGAAHLG